MPLLIAKDAMKTSIKNSVIASMKLKYPTLEGRSDQIQDFIDSIADGVVDGIIDGILANATITVTSVTGVTTGLGISGPGTGTIT